MTDALHPDLQSLARIRFSIGPRSLRVMRLIGRIGALRPSSVEQVAVSATASVRLHRPDGAERVGDHEAPALLWVHGGGYVGGAARADDGLCADLARRLGVLVASVEYRLAPDDPYPAALDDCCAALTYLAGRPDVDAGRVAVGGASAGGGLAAAVALRARDQGRVSPVLQLLVYPMLDDRTVVRTDHDTSGVRVWMPGSNAFGWRSYLDAAPGSADVPHLAAPARCPDLAGVAPAWVGVGTLDLFHDEDLVYAQRLREAGVPCDLEVVPGAVHGFDAVRPQAPVSRRFRDAWVVALAAALGVTARA